MKHNLYLRSLLRIILASIIIISFSSNVAFQQDSTQPRDVISDSTYTYIGWAGNPESITVYIDNTFTDAEKDSVRVAIQRWNTAGCVPALTEVATGPANVTVTEGDPGVDPVTGIPNAGVYDWEMDANDKVISGTIIIRKNPNPGLVETATHELGHALGLDDTDPNNNPGDVMKGSGPPNGTNGELSPHDLSQLQAAAAVANTPVGAPPVEKVYCIEPNQAITPGELSMLSFLLPFDYPPETEYMVTPIANDLLLIEFVELFDNNLNIGVITEPNHWSGQIYFDILIFMDDGEPHQYTGIHYVSQNPVPPVEFECLFNTVIDGNQVLVQWNGLHTYPFPDRPLRSTLSVNGNRYFKVNPSADAPEGYYGDYTITLEPGIHALTLVVDDYQVNRASFTLDVVIEEPPPPVPYFALAPDGKSNPDPWYRWISNPEGVTPVNFYTNLHDNDITEVRFYYAHDHTSEWMLFWTDIDGTSNSAPGDPDSESNDHDGWCGYLYHEMLGLIPSELFFKAEVETSDGIVHETLSATSLYYTLTPPNAFLITTSEGHVIENEYVTDQEQVMLHFTPLHEHFEYAQFQHSDLPKDYDKGTPQVEQPNNYYCGPAALAMCLKYFAEKSPDQWGHVTGGLSDGALMDSLANRCGTVSPKGTTENGMESGASGWIDKQGGGFKVEGFKEFSEFGKDKMVQHLLHDYQKNNVSQNIISRFMFVTHDNDTLYHYMTLSSVHDKGAGYNRFNYADPMQKPPPVGGKLAFDLDDEGNASNFTWDDGEEIEGFQIKEAKLLSSMMICPNEPAIVSEEGEIAEGPEFPPVEVDTPEGSSTGTRVRAVDLDGNKYETDIIVRRPPKTVCPDEFTLPLGGAPHKLDECTPGGGSYSGPHVDDGWFYPDFPGEFIITYTLNFYGYEISTDFIISVAGYDFGDAPDDPYPTLLANNGARHLMSPDLYLGQLVDAEMDGQPCPFALGDDQDGTDDEDGIRFLNSFLPGEIVTIEATVFGTGYLNAWFDWEANGSWHDPGNHTIVNQQVSTGIHTFDITVPDYAAIGFTFARFRLTSQSGLSFQGTAPDGEVEDYRIKINEPMDHKMHYPQYPDPAGWDVFMPTLQHVYEIGDDWLCSETGYVEDIHFWVSWKEDIVPQNLDIEFHIKIFSDIPAPESNTGYSMPGTILWQRTFGPGSYVYEEVFEHPQGWLNPFVPDAEYMLWDHDICHKVDILNIPDPFLQEEGTVYWLVLSANMPETVPQIGWKTSLDHFNDVAVWYNPFTAWGWELLLDPVNQHDLSLAFVINGNPIPPTYNLIVVAEPTYAGVVLGGGNFLPGEIVPLTAIASEGWEFENWTDDQGNVISNDDIFDYTMPESDITLTANFTPAAFVVYCPDDIETVNDQGACFATNIDLGEPTIEESFEIIEMYNNAPDEFPVGTTIVTWTLINEFEMTSTCDQLITVIDVEDPEFEDMEDLHRDNDPGACGANVYWEPPEVTDNCGVESIESTHQPGDFFPVGITTVVYTAEDIHGNTSYSGFRIEVIDIEPPEIEPLVDIEVVAAPGASGANVYWDTPEVTDNCEVASVEVSHNSGDFFPTGDTVVTYTATDPSGNEAQESFTVTVHPPSFPNELQLDGLIITEDDGPQCFEAAIAIYMMNSTVESGADVSLVAGEYIKILPGTHIKHGAQFVARIDLDGTFCDDTKARPAADVLDAITPQAPIKERDIGLFFKVYPNPTDGIFTLELLTDVEKGSIQVEVFALYGSRVLRQKLPPQPIHMVDLTHFQPGMYIIRVSAGDHSGFARLIKK